MFFLWNGTSMDAPCTAYTDAPIWSDQHDWCDDGFRDAIAVQLWI
jgi:hypothetical protein